MDVTARYIDWQNFVSDLQKTKGEFNGAEQSILISSDDESTPDNTDISANALAEARKERRGRKPKCQKVSPLASSRSNRSSTLVPPNAPFQSDSQATINDSAVSSHPQGCLQSAPNARVSTILPASTSIPAGTFQVTLPTACNPNKLTPLIQSAHVQPRAVFTVPGYDVNNFCIQAKHSSCKSVDSMLAPETALDLSQKLWQQNSQGDVIRRAGPIKRPRKHARKGGATAAKNVAVIRPTSSRRTVLPTPLQKMIAMADFQYPISTNSVHSPHRDPQNPTSPEIVSCQFADANLGTWHQCDKCSQCVNYAKSVNPLLRQLRVMATRPTDLVNVMEVKRTLTEMDNQVFAMVMLQLLGTFPEKMMSLIAILGQQ